MSGIVLMSACMHACCSLGSKLCLNITAWEGTTQTNQLTLLIALINMIFTQLADIHLGKKIKEY